MFVCVTLLCHFYSTRVARYVPNIAKEGYMRSVWILTTDRPPGQFTHFGIISNGHNSATRHPIPFMFVLGGFSGTVDRTALFPIGSNLRWRPSWKTSNGQISETHYPIHCMYVYRPYFALGLKSIMTEIRNLFHKGGSLADLRYKGKERKGRSWEIVEKITHEDQGVYIRLVTI